MRFINSGTSGITSNCGSPVQAIDLADLLRVEALGDGEILWQQIGRAVEREAEQEIAQRAEAEIAAAEQPEIDQRLAASMNSSTTKAPSATAATRLSLTMNGEPNQS